MGFNVWNIKLWGGEGGGSGRKLNVLSFSSNIDFLTQSIMYTKYTMPTLEGHTSGRKSSLQKIYFEKKIKNWRIKLGVIFMKYARYSPVTFLFMSIGVSIEYACLWTDLSMLKVRCFETGPWRVLDGRCLGCMGLGGRPPHELLQAHKQCNTSCRWHTQWLFIAKIFKNYPKIYHLKNKMTQEFTLEPVISYEKTTREYTWSLKNLPECGARP